MMVMMMMMMMMMMIDSKSFHKLGINIKLCVKALFVLLEIIYTFNI